MKIAFEDIVVTKASGERDVFSVEKLQRSLERSGADPDIIASIIKEVKSQLYTGINTKKIYQVAFSLLKKYSRVCAGRYNIRKGLMDLGPSGFPFEKYLAEILRFQGYETEVNQLITGHCVIHEVDVVARKNKVRCMIECKFHNSRGMTCDVKIPLYIHSRFMDVEQGWLKTDIDKTISNEGWLVTNTKFTSDAIQYGNCAGLKLTGWNYPRRGSLQEWIELSGLYPLTCLTTLTSAEKAEILLKGTVLCRDIPNKKQLLRTIGISEKRIDAIVRESTGISSSIRN